MAIPLSPAGPHPPASGSLRPAARQRGVPVCKSGTHTSLRRLRAGKVGPGRCPNRQLLAEYRDCPKPCQPALLSPLLRRRTAQKVSRCDLHQRRNLPPTPLFRQTRSAGRTDTRRRDRGTKEVRRATARPAPPPRRPRPARRPGSAPPPAARGCRDGAAPRPPPSATPPPAGRGTSPPRGHTAAPPGADRGRSAGDRGRAAAAPRAADSGHAPAAGRRAR